LSVLPVYHSENSANGTDSGSESRIVSGWITLSNCEARIMYMKMTDRRKTHRNSVKVFSISRALPVTNVE
jgi:hypothetical protein